MMKKTYLLVATLFVLPTFCVQAEAQSPEPGEKLFLDHSTISQGEIAVGVVGEILSNPTPNLRTRPKGDDGILQTDRVMAMIHGRIPIFSHDRSRGPKPSNYFSIEAFQAPQTDQTDVAMIT